MVHERVILGHMVPNSVVDMDIANIEAIRPLPTPISIKRTRSFLGYTRFYCRFIKNFSKSANLQLIRRQRCCL